MVPSRRKTWRHRPERQEAGNRKSAVGCAVRVGRLAGVKLAGLVGEVPLDAVTITVVPVNDPSAPPTLGPALMATFPELLDAVRGHIVTGRYFDTGHAARADRAAVLGSRADFGLDSPAELQMQIAFGAGGRQCSLPDSRRTRPARRRSGQRQGHSAVGDGTSG